MTRRWTKEDVNKLLSYRVMGLSFEKIAEELNRSIDACHTKYYSQHANVDYDRTKLEILKTSVRGIQTQLNQQYNNKYIMALVKKLLEDDGYEVSSGGVWTETGFWPIGIAIGDNIQINFDRMQDRALMWISKNGDFKLFTPVESLEPEEE